MDTHSTALYSWLHISHIKQKWNALTVPQPSQAARSATPSLSFTQVLHKKESMKNTQESNLVLGHSKFWASIPQPLRESGSSTAFQKWLKLYRLIDKLSTEASFTKEGANDRYTRKQSGFSSFQILDFNQAASNSKEVQFIHSFSEMAKNISLLNQLINCPPYQLLILFHISFFAPLYLFNKDAISLFILGMSTQLSKLIIHSLSSHDSGWLGSKHPLTNKQWNWSSKQKSLKNSELVWFFLKFYVQPSLAPTPKTHFHTAVTDSSVRYLQEMGTVKQLLPWFIKEWQTHLQDTWLAPASGGWCHAVAPSPSPSSPRLTGWRRHSLPGETAKFKTEVNSSPVGALSRVNHKGLYQGWGRLSWRGM